MTDNAHPLANDISHAEASDVDDYVYLDCNDPEYSTLNEDPSVLQHDVLENFPTTSLGTYLEGTNDGLEELEEYQYDGFHPVHIGDCFGYFNRYRVIQKLGFGGFGTVWLCRDRANASYVALKVMAADASYQDTLDSHIAQLDQSAPGAEYIATPLDQFIIAGPNGEHQCLVLPVFGPSIASGFWINIKGDRGAVLRKMAFQAVQALHFLHQNQICHGDFQSFNILVKLSDFNHLSEQDLLSIIGQPRIKCVRTESVHDLPIASPRYLVESAHISRLCDAYMTDQIRIIDFGLAFHFSSPPEELGLPGNYRPPEMLLEKGAVAGPACDLWALGCTLFEIREQIPLFDTMYYKAEQIGRMVCCFGKLPDEWWDKWDAKAGLFDSKGNCLRPDLFGEDVSLEALLNQPHVADPPVQSVLEVPEAEQRIMADLIRKICQYDPSKRLGLEEVMEHEWFKL